MRSYPEMHAPVVQQLAQLNLVSNAISGSIPTCIATLPQLVELHLVRQTLCDMRADVI